MSLFMLAPVALFVEGVKFTPAYLQSAVSRKVVIVNHFHIMINVFLEILICTICFHL